MAIICEICWEMQFWEQFEVPETRSRGAPFQFQFQQKSCLYGRFKIWVWSVFNRNTEVHFLRPASSVSTRLSSIPCKGFSSPEPTLMDLDMSSLEGPSALYTAQGSFNPHGYSESGPAGPAYASFSEISIKFDLEMIQRSWKQFQIEKNVNFQGKKWVWVIP